LSYEILGVHVHLSKCGRGTSLSVEMQKGYMVICQNAEGIHDKQKVGNPCYPVEIFFLVREHRSVYIINSLLSANRMRS